MKLSKYSLSVVLVAISAFSGLVAKAEDHGKGNYRPNTTDDTKSLWGTSNSGTDKEVNDTFNLILGELKGLSQKGFKVSTSGDYTSTLIGVLGATGNAKRPTECDMVRSSVNPLGCIHAIIANLRTALHTQLKDKVGSNAKDIDEAIDRIETKLNGLGVVPVRTLLVSLAFHQDSWEDATPKDLSANVRAMNQVLKNGGKISLAATMDLIGNIKEVSKQNQISPEMKFEINDLSEKLIKAHGLNDLIQVGQ